MQDGTTVADFLVVSSARTKRKDRGDDIGSSPSPVPQPPDATRLHLSHDCAGLVGDLLGIVVKPLDLYLVNVGSISTGPTHGEGRLQPHPGDVLKPTPNVRRSPRSGLNVEGRLSDLQIRSFG